MNLLEATAYVLFCGFLATRSSRRWMSPGPAGRVALAWLVLFATFSFGAFYLLGFINLITGWPVVQVSLAAALNGAFALIALAKGRRARGAALTALSWLRRRGRGVWRELDGAARLLSGATVATFLLLAAILCTEFPRGYEPRAYHLPIAAQIFQTQGLQVWDREYMDAFPANASLYYGFLLRFLPEHFVAASDVPLLAVLLLALYGLGRATGADRSAALVAACGAATIPIVAVSSLECGADIGGAAFLGAAVYFALGGEAPRLSDELLAGLAAGLAFGFKSLHLVSAGFLFVVIFLRRWWSADPLGAMARLRTAVRGSTLFLAAFLGIAAVWLVRNSLEFGNPLYPVHLGALSDALGMARPPDIDYLGRVGTQFEWVRSPGEWFLYPWIEWQVHNENFKHSSGLGAFFAAMVPTAILVSLLGLLSRKAKGRSLLVFLLTGCGFLFTVWWALADRQPRYLMGLLVYEIPLVAWMISQSAGWRRRVFGWIAGGTAIFMLGVFLSKQTVEFASRLRYGQWARHEFYDYPEEVDHLPQDSTVVNLVSRPLNWGLLGASHENRVVNSRRALRALGASLTEAPPAMISLDAGVLRRLGATHLVALAGTSLRPGPGVALTEVGRPNWKSVEPLTLPVLYRVDYHADRSGVGQSSLPQIVFSMPKNE